MKKVLFTVTLSSLLALSGCASNSSGEQDGKTSNTAKGAGIGAAAGAVIGAMTSSKKDRAKGAAIGAVAGAAIGGGTGYAMDKREERLRQRMSDTGVEIERKGETLQVVIPDNVSFDSGSAALSQGFYPSMNKLAEELKSDTGTVIRVYGHTDNVGNEKKNQQLSYQRARTVALYIRNQGVALDRFEIHGAGSTEPVADNSTAEGRAQNRRVVITLVPSGKIVRG